MPSDDQVNFIIRPGVADDLLGYLEICQQSAAQAYSHPTINQLDLFSAEHFFHPSIMPYWRDMATNKLGNYWWVAESTSDQKIIGGICLTDRGSHFEGRGFYVAPAWQHQGIGRQLMAERDKRVTKPLIFEVFAHADDTIAYHQRHGAVPTGV